MPNDVAELPAGVELGGRFRIRREIGRGGMGVVYEAEQLALEREVALKILSPDLVQDPAALERFQREARAAAAIEHDGIVRVFDFATEDGVAFIVMERLRGEDLRSRIKRVGALSWQEVIKLGSELADAIAAAHERGILHRDLSPANVFLARNDAGREGVKVLDFGVARLLSAAGLRSQPTLGTLMYMAPERVAGADSADPRSDVYAIGAVLYEALAGVPPYPVCEYPELALKIALQAPLSLRARTPSCPAAVLEVVERAMHKDPERRWQSARELCSALTAVPAGLAQPVVPDVSGTAGTPPLRTARGGRTRRLLWVSGTLLAGAAVLVAFAVKGSWDVAVEAAAQRSQSGAVAPSESQGAAFVARAAKIEDSVPPPSGGGTQATSTPRVTIVTHPPGAQVSVSGAGSCRSPCSLEIAPRAGLVVSAQDGQLRAQRRLALPLPSQVELWLRPERSAASAKPPMAPLPPLMPRR